MFVNFWMRWFVSSATKTLPLASTATPTGLLNCPLPEPGPPQVVRKVPHDGTVVEVVLVEDEVVELVVVVVDEVVVVVS